MNILSHAAREGQPNDQQEAINMQKTACINGVEYAVIGEAKAPSGAMVIVLDVPMMNDITMQRMSLLERLRRPDVYATLENVPEAVNRLEMWLEVNDPDIEAWYAEHEPEYDMFDRWFHGHDSSDEKKGGDAE